MCNVRVKNTKTIIYKFRKKTNQSQELCNKSQNCMVPLNYFFHIQNKTKKHPNLIKIITAYKPGAMVEEGCRAVKAGWKSSFSPSNSSDICVRLPIRKQIERQSTCFAYNWMRQLWDTGGWGQRLETNMQQSACVTEPYCNNTASFIEMSTMPPETLSVWGILILGM